MAYLKARTLAQWSFALCFLFMAPGSGAVELSSNGQGGALVIPVFVANERVSTLISLTNMDSEHPRGRAVKANIRDRDGELLYSINIYLPVLGVWTAAIESRNSGPRISLPGPACSIARVNGESAPVDSLDLEVNGGYIELIEMGTLEDFDGDSAAGQFNCSKLADLWTDGIWSDDGNDGIGSPMNTLRASVSLVNIQGGIMYSMVATALAPFSNIPRHTEPGSNLPNLGSAHDSGTPNDATRSRICTSEGCVEQTWSNPRDAVAAALMTHELEAEFNLEAATQTKSEYLFTYPLKYLYDHNEWNDAFEVAFFASDRTGEIAGLNSEVCDPPGPFFCARLATLQHSRAVEIFDLSQSVDDFDESGSSNILGLDLEVAFGMEGLTSEAGTAKFGLENLESFFPRSNEGSVPLGVPAIGYALQEFTNGTIRDEVGDRVRANYGNSFPMTRTARIPGRP